MRCAEALQAPPPPVTFPGSTCGGATGQPQARKACGPGWGGDDLQLRPPAQAPRASQGRPLLGSSEMGGGQNRPFAKGKTKTFIPSSATRDQKQQLRDLAEQSRHAGAAVPAPDA